MPKKKPKRKPKDENQCDLFLQVKSASCNQKYILEKTENKDLFKKMKKKPKYEIQYIVAQEVENNAIQLLYFKSGAKPMPAVIVQSVNQIHYLLWELILKEDIHHESLRDLLEHEELIRDTISQRPLLSSWFDYWEKRRAENIEIAGADSMLVEKINQAFDSYTLYKDFWYIAGSTLIHIAQLNGLEIVKVLDKYLDLDAETALPDIEKQEMLMAYIPGSKQERADVKVVDNSCHTTVVTDALGAKSRVKATELVGSADRGYHTIIRENPQAYAVKLKTDLSNHFFSRNPKQIINSNQYDKIITRYNWQTKDIEITTTFGTTILSIPESIRPSTQQQCITAKINDIESVKIGNVEVSNPLDMELVFKYGYECLSVIRRLTPFQKVVGYPDSIDPALQRYLLERVNPFMQSYAQDSIRLILSSRNQFIIDYYKRHQCTQFFQHALEECFYMTCYEILAKTRMPIDFEHLYKTHADKLQWLISREATDPEEHVLADGNGSKESARMIHVIKDKPKLRSVSLRRFLEIYQRCPELIMTVFSKETSIDFYSSICELVKIAFSKKHPRCSALNFLITQVKKRPELLRFLVMLESLDVDFQELIAAYNLEQVEKINEKPSKSELDVDKISFIDQKTLGAYRDKIQSLLDRTVTHIMDVSTFTEGLSPSAHHWMTTQNAEKKDILQQQRPDNVPPSLWTTWLSNCIDWLRMRKRLETLLLSLSGEVPSTLFPSYSNDLARKEQTVLQKIQLDLRIRSQIESTLKEGKSKKSAKKTSKSKTVQAPNITPPSKQPTTSQKKEKPVIPSQLFSVRSQYLDIENLVKPFFDHEFAYCCGDEAVRHMLVIRFLVLLMETCFVVEKYKMKKLLNWSTVHYARNLYSHYAYFIESDKINVLINEMDNIHHLFLASSSFESIQEGLQNFIDTANEIGNSTLQQRHKVRLFSRGEAITTSHHNTAQILYRMDEDRDNRRETRYEEVVTQLATFDENLTMADFIKEKLLLVELGEHAKASTVISNHATKQFGQKKLHYAMLQRNKLLHRYATKSPDEFVMPIKSALIQDCRLNEHNKHSLSLQGMGLFQEPLAEKSSAKLCL